ncbi:MAG TPA: LysM peptidoglycan-binding domain-containing protein [Gemmatimonadales bacterium]
MLRSFSWKWLGTLALVVSPAVVYGQATMPETHTVKAGDTLWQLAKQFRGDPFLWPDIYRINTGVVEDPHWIYPGEVLRLSGTETLAAVPAVDTPVPAAASEAPVAEAPVAETPVAEAPVAEAPAPVAEAPNYDVTSADTLRRVEAAAVAPLPSAEPVDSVVREPVPGRQATLSELLRAPVGEGEPEPLFGPPPANTLQETILAYTRKDYRPLRRIEFYSSGFLTENENLPWAKVVGPVTPSQIGSPVINDVLPYATIAIEAPRGASYQIGDTLLLAQRGIEVKPFGTAVLPTGLARITDTVSGRYIASVEAVYAPIRPNQVALPAEKFTSAGGEHAVPVSDGVRGKFLGGPRRQELKAPQMIVFIDKGRRDGVATGDIFEVRRKAERLDNGQQRINELLATFQIVHVRDHTATGRYLNILLPDITPGMEVRQVAKLPS